MSTQNASEIKEKILVILRQKGPSLPVHVSQRIGISMLFAGAFLSELISDQKIKISNMRVGNSPVYFLPGQEPLIANFAQHLKSKEKEAFVLLKEKKFLKDIEQQPAIRVALRALKDFAIPFKNNQEIYWRYLTIPESELKITETIPKPRVQESVVQTPKIQETPIQTPNIPIATKLNIFDEKEPKPVVIKKVEKTKPTIKKVKKSVSNTKQDKFFNKIKDLLNTKGIEITDIIGFNKTNLTLKVNKDGEKILIAFNKRRIDEKDFINCHKKSQEYKLPYIILALGEPNKKIQSLISAIKNLDSIVKIE